MADKKLKSYTLSDYLESLNKCDDKNKDADYIVLQANIQKRLHDDIIQIGKHLTINEMQPPLVFAFVHYFIFFWSHIKPFIKDEQDKRYVEYVFKDVMYNSDQFKDDIVRKH